MAHSDISDDGKYTYIAFSPDVSNLLVPRSYKANNRQGSPYSQPENGSELIEDLHAVRAETLAVPIPQDPVVKGPGYLRVLWKDTLRRHSFGSVSS